MVGVVLETRKFPQVQKIYGPLNCVRGIINEEFLDLTQETTNNIEKVACTPSSALLSTRDKQGNEYCNKIFTVLEAHNIRYFIYIRGNYAAETVRIVNEKMIQSDYELRTIHK